MDTAHQAGQCPHCGQKGRPVNLIVDDEDTRRHADLESSGAYDVCDDCQCYWHVSTQFFEYIENEEAVRNTTRLIKATYRQVSPLDDDDGTGWHDDNANPAPVF